MKMPHQVITRALGAVVHVAIIRDPASGTAVYTVEYQSGGANWMSRHRFSDSSQAEAGCLVLADFLGAEFR
jgi:hypothetical protein